MTTFRPQRDMLPEPQLALWPELAPMAALGFVLYGGTALVLRLGHRESIDFDFFAAPAVDKARITATNLLQNGKIIQDAPDTLTLLVEREGGTVKVSFFSDLVPTRIRGRVGEPQFTDDRTLLVASIDDLFATKVKVVLDRAEAKDYRDIAALLRSGASLERALGAAQAIYGPAYQPAESVKALSYFGDGDLSTVSADDRACLAEAAALVRNLPDVPLRATDLN
ncbi:MAG TPA: nucleotidyl transferase AbiEii/AbiGii toxin family protein [Xanthomonadales bacterium]|nr:nucleotidyl transferase AbiEii/AbiGii toxin family protein [Xanthomonadales bacterium]